MTNVAQFLVVHFRNHIIRILTLSHIPLYIELKDEYKFIWQLLFCLENCLLYTVEQIYIPAANRDPMFLV